MTTYYFPKATTSGPPTATDRVTLRAAAILTNADVASDDVNCMGFTKCVPSCVFTKGSLTSLRIRVEGFDGTDWQQLPFKPTQSAGYSLVTPDLLEMTASYSGALPKVDTIGFQRFRLVVIGNGTVTSSSLTLTCGGAIAPVIE